MTQPTAYQVATNFAADEAAALTGRATVRTPKVDAEFAAIQLTIGQILTNLSILQRDDTALNDSLVTIPTLSSAVKALFAVSGITVRDDWVTATAYAVKDIVNVSGATYLCATANTSDTFAVDLAAKKWMIIANAPNAFAASAISNTPAGNIAATDVQAALNELDTEKLAKASNLSDLANAVTALANLGALALAGGTMSGLLLLSADPAAALGAATKQYADAVIAGQLAGQCTFAVTSTVQAKLSPRNGNRLFIAGVWYTIGSAGVTVSNAGLSASTTYYCYAYNNGGSIALELSTTVYAVDTTYGHTVKNGDTSRVLVGMVRTQSGSAIFETAETLFLSWFNRKLRANRASFSVNRPTASVAAVELSSEIRVPFLTWANEVVDMKASGFVSNSGASSCHTFIGIDGASNRANGSFMSNTDNVPICPQEALSTLAEGYHYATLCGLVTGGTGTWGASSISGCRITVKVMG